MGKRTKFFILGLILVGIVILSVCLYKRKYEQYGTGGHSGSGGSSHGSSHGGYRRWSGGLGGGGLPSYWDMPYYASATYLGVNQDCSKTCTKNFKDCLSSDIDRQSCEKIVGACLDKC